MYNMFTIFTVRLCRWKSVLRPSVLEQDNGNSVTKLR